MASSKKKPYGKMIFFGIIAAVLYSALLMEQDFVNSTFTKGGLYAFLPILTAFVFSFMHGNFTGSFWSVLGINASKKTKEVK